MKKTILLADIGGTHARFALMGEEGDLSQLTSFYCAQYDSLLSVVRAYLKGRVGALSRAVLAIAAPVSGDVIHMTNHNWIIRKEEMKAALALEDILFVNDFFALARAIPALSGEERVQIGGGTSKPNEPIVVMGPGTGLGVSALFWQGDTLQVMGGEGGHVDFAPQNEFEWKLREYLSARYGHVSVERVLSGQGLLDLHTFYCEMHSLDFRGFTPTDITQEALGGKGHCVEVLKVFCEILGGVAGNFALAVNAGGGVYIGGGMVPRFLDFLKKSSFRERFESRGRFSPMLSQTPVFVIMDRVATLKGAWACAEQT